MSSSNFVDSLSNNNIVTSDEDSDDYGDILFSLTSDLKEQELVSFTFELSPALSKIKSKDSGINPFSRRK